MTVLGAGLALAACGSSAAQATEQVHATAASATSRATTAGPALTRPASYGNPSGHAPVPAAAGAVSTASPTTVIGTGSPASCTSAAVVRAVAKGGVITFSCGPNPVTITMAATAKVVNTHRRTVIDGGGKVTLSGGGKIRILYMNTCDPKQVYTTSDCWQQKWPQLVVQNLTFRNAYSAVRQTKTSDYGGGAIFAEGGQLKVVNTGFFSNRCYKYGPDLGGAAIRALGMYAHRPVYITKDTFRGGRCSNGGALSSIDASWNVLDSLMVNNKTTGRGENPQAKGTPGGGSGGAIYTDGDSYNVTINGSAIRFNTAAGGEGGAVFFVVDSGHGVLTIEHSTLHHNPAGGYDNAPGIFDDVDQKVTYPTVIDSKIN
ncbi:MAG TPA: hypothetical protein VMA32_06120 [Streptosporangiaceae bacterium]|nr:hypothetical protein [Streptosporangiaceae bacterium]